MNAEVPTVTFRDGATAPPNGISVEGECNEATGYFEVYLNRESQTGARLNVDAIQRITCGPPG